MDGLVVGDDNHDGVEVEEDGTVLVEVEVDFRS